MTVGEGMDFEKLLVYLTVAEQRTTPVIELVAFYRVKNQNTLQLETLCVNWQSQTSKILATYQHTKHVETTKQC